MTLCKTNDIKKGARVQLANGWYATMADNRKGDVRVATVEGVFTETGSIYAHDIVRAEHQGAWVLIDHTPRQIAMKHRVTTWGF